LPAWLGIAGPGNPERYDDWRGADGHPSAEIAYDCMCLAARCFAFAKPGLKGGRQAPGTGHFSSLRQCATKDLLTLSWQG
jgi:hypothetical protein